MEARRSSPFYGEMNLNGVTCGSRRELHLPSFRGLGGVDLGHLVVSFCLLYRASHWGLFGILMLIGRQASSMGYFLSWWFCFYGVKIDLNATSFEMAFCERYLVNLSNLNQRPSSVHHDANHQITNKNWSETGKACLFGSFDDSHPCRCSSPAVS